MYVGNVKKKMKKNKDEEDDNEEEDEEERISIGQLLKWHLFLRRKISITNGAQISLHFLEVGTYPPFYLWE